MPETQHHPHMQADARKQDAGNHEDVQREETGQRGSGDDGTAQKSMHE